MTKEVSTDAAKIVEVTNNYKSESRESKKDRMEKNKLNYDVYHLKQDFSHKRPGQSREFVAKQSMAVEQIVSFFQQGLVDTGEWFRVIPENGVTDPLFSENEISLLLSRHLDKAGFLAFVGNALKTGLLASLMIVKVHGKYCKYPKFYTQTKLDGLKFKKVLKKEEKLYWDLKFDIVRPEDFYIDPTCIHRGKPLYECQDIWMDIADAYKLSEGPHALYDRKKVDLIAASISEEEEQKIKKAREEGQNSTLSNYRRRVKVTECWGDILEPGSGKLLHENVTWAVMNDRILIKEPTPNPFWHGESPFVLCPIIQVPNNVWGKALMDAPTRFNIAINELYNLIIDGGMMATHGIKQLRPDWLEDMTDVENGIYPGQTIRASSNCPPGMKVMERIDTASLSSESLAVYNLINQEFNQSALTNDLRMGVLPSRAVKATEVVEASQTITSVFTGMAKVIETEFIEKILRKSWLTMLQNMDDIETTGVQDLIGESRAQQIATISPEDRFARSATGYKFKAFGVSSILSKIKDFKKLTALLQTISGSELLVEEFMKRFSMGKMLEEIMKSLDINTERIKVSEDEKMALTMAAAQGSPMGQGSLPNAQSQIPQAGAGSTNQTVESMIPRTNFPRTSGGVQT